MEENAPAATVFQPTLYVRRPLHRVELELIHALEKYFNGGNVRIVELSDNDPRPAPSLSLAPKGPNSRITGNISILAALAVYHRCPPPFLESPLER